MKANLQHFMLAGISQRVAVEKSLSDFDFRGRVTSVERFSDHLIKDYISVPDHETKLQSERMSEYYRLFYLLENEIRNFIVDMIAQDDDPEWWTKKVPENVRNNADKNVQREKKEGSIPRSDHMIDYTTFGELSEIIKANWDVFNGVFTRHDIPGVERVLQQLNMLRGPIAHCGVLAEEDVVKLKLVMRNWYRLME